MYNNVRKQILSIISFVAPTTSELDNIKGWLDDLDFAEILMRVEIDFDVTINDDISIFDFKNVKELIDYFEKILN